MLSICLKKVPRQDDSPKISLRKFVACYLNKFYGELNEVLGNYRSVREHGHRNRMIEFASSKIKDIELFLMVVKGAYLQRDLRITTLKKYDYMEQGSHLVGMADFIAGMFENMKISFIPRHNFAMALQAAIDPSKLLPSPPEMSVPRGQYPRQVVEKGVNSSESEDDILSDTHPSTNPDFEEINRLIKIYLLKEDVSNYEIRDGLLILRSTYMTLEMALCGNYAAPSWMLVSAKAVFDEPGIEQLLVSKLPQSLQGIHAFIAFYEARRLAYDVFSNLKGEATGFYQNFTGKIRDYIVQGQLKESRFVCLANAGDKAFHFVNKSYAYIVESLKETGAHETATGFEDHLRTTDYRKEAFGENYTLFLDYIYLCFPKGKLLFYLGDRMAGNSGKRVALRLKDGKLIGYLGGGEEKQNAHSGAATVSLPSIIDFVKRNRGYFTILYQLLPLANRLVFDEGITTPLYSISADYTITYTSAVDQSNGFSSIEEYSCADAGRIISKARLLYLQRYPPEDFAVLENRIGEKLILEIHKIQVLVALHLKTALRHLTDDCRHFNVIDGLAYIRKFGALYKYNLFPLAYNMNQVIIDLSELTGEMVAIERASGKYRIRGPNTVKMLRVGKIFCEEDLRTIGILHKAYIVNRFSYIKNLFGSGVIGKNTVELPNGCRIILTSEGLTFIMPDGATNSELTRALSLERSIIECLKWFGGEQNGCMKNPGRAHRNKGQK